MINTLPPSPALSPVRLPGPTEKEPLDHGIRIRIKSRTFPIANGLHTPEDRELTPESSRDFTAHVEDADDHDSDDVFKPAGGGASHATSSYPIPPLKAREESRGDFETRHRATIHTYADDKDGAFPRISRPVELMRNSYDYVVIGSGYGGAVAASRLARSVGAEGGRGSVCVLERGKERWPGEYPSGVVEGLKNLHVTGEFAHQYLPTIPISKGDPTSMYHLILGRGINAVVGNGLGGTSLMNANIFLRADSETLCMPFWPKEIRDDKDCLEKYYQKVEEVLEPTAYPDDWPALPKVKLLERQAEALGMRDKFRMAPQTTRFRNGPNSCGVEMSPSALTGEDATGVNDGSKTTTLVTYLADAWNWGAEMFCECEVRHIEECRGPEGGYVVYYSWHGRNRGKFGEEFHDDVMWVHAKKCVFLGAGSIGTTEILLRSKEMGLAMSDRVGLGMSGNGDMLAFGYNTDFEANAIGNASPDPYNPIGPTINSLIDNRHGHDNPLDGFVIEEGAIPSALAGFLQAMLEVLPGRVEPKGDTPLEKVRSKMARLGSLVFGPYLQGGAIDNTQVYLVMSHDSCQAVMSLKDDKPVLEFLGINRSDHVNKINKLLAEATQKVGGTFVQNPFYALMGQSQVTVHPIGGACMARDNTGRTGVTNHMGEILKGDGAETHNGLIVMDGAIIPAALGVNPFATITAIAERNIDLYAQKNGLLFQDEKNGILDLFGQPAHPFVDITPEREELTESKAIDEVSSTISNAKDLKAGGLGFTEVMSGFIHRDRKGTMISDERETYERAYHTAKSLCESARFFLSVQAFDTKSLVCRPDHSAMLTGTFVCPVLEGSPFMVQRGSFNLFVTDPKSSNSRNMTYDFDMRGTDRSLLHFHGYKVIDSSVTLSVRKFWKATTTLYVTITKWPADGKERDNDPNGWRRGEVVAKGMMHLSHKDFRSQLRTLTPTGAGFFKRAWSVASFFHYFSSRSIPHFLGPFAPIQYPSATYDGYINDTPPDASYVIVASDGVKSRMHMWEPTNGSVQARNLFMIPGASVDHQIFALPTIPYNAVNYFTRAGYRVFVSVHRIGQLMVAQNDHTTYDARLDLRACLEYIRANFREDRDELGLQPPNPGNKVYCIAHCMGSVAFSTGLLEGTIPASWVMGVTCSQVFMNPIWNTLNMIKIMASPVPMDKLYKAVAGNWFSVSTGKDDRLVQKVVNEALRFYPGERKEVCNNASCHRCSLVFGRCWNHKNLNEATHRQINRFFGGVNMTLLNLLMRQGKEGHAMTNNYEELDTAENVARLRGLPFFLFVGADNAVLSQEATERTYSVLCDTFGSDGRAGEVRDQQKDLGEKDGAEKEEGAVQNGFKECGCEDVMYRRRVIPGYGHLDCWMGKNAWRDVYPLAREEVDRVVRGGEYRFVEPDDKFKKMVFGDELLY